MRSFIFFYLYIFFFYGNQCFFAAELSQSEPSTSNEVRLPHPSNLKANWWSYFQVDSERLGVRIQKMQAVLENLKGDLSARQKERALPLIHQITTGLNVYWNLSKQKLGTAIPPEPTFQETYNLKNFLELGEKIKEAELSYKLQKREIKIEQANLRSDISHLDMLTAVYLSFPSTDPSHIIKGPGHLQSRIKF